MGKPRHPLCESSVCIYKPQSSGYTLSAYHPFMFKVKNVKIIKDSLKMIIQLATSVTLGKTSNVNICNDYQPQIYLPYDMDIQPGRYKIDPEETNEDQLVFYFEDKIEEKCNEDLKEEAV